MNLASFILPSRPSDLLRIASVALLVAACGAEADLETSFGSVGVPGVEAKPFVCENLKVKSTLAVAASGAKIDWKVELNPGQYLQVDGSGPRLEGDTDEKHYPTLTVHTQAVNQPIMQTRLMPRFRESGGRSRKVVQVGTDTKETYSLEFIPGTRHRNISIQCIEVLDKEPQLENRRWVMHQRECVIGSPTKQVPPLADTRCQVDPLLEAFDCRQSIVDIAEDFIGPKLGEWRVSCKQDTRDRQVLGDSCMPLLKSCLPGLVCKISRADLLDWKCDWP